MVTPHETRPLAPDRAATGSNAAERAKNVTEARSSARAGQVPLTSSGRARLCFLAAPVSSKGSMSSQGTMALDWEGIAARRRRLAALGFGVAEALEPEERRALGWDTIAELVRRTGALELASGFVAGAAADHLRGAPTVRELVEGVAHQASAIEEAGGVPVLLPLPALARRRATEGEFVDAYRAILERMSGPVLIDWVGAHRRPELAGSFPGKSFERVLALDPAKLRGARLELDDAVLEARLRRVLRAQDQLAFTGERKHLAALVLGDTSDAAQRVTEFAGHSVQLGDFCHVLASGLEPQAELLAAALERLTAGDEDGYLTRIATL